MNFGDVVRRHAASRGDSPAFTDERGTLDWRSFNDRVNRLVGALREQGLVAGDRVGVLAGNGTRYWETYVACAKGGFAAVPVNTRLVAAEVAYIGANAGVAAWICEAPYDALRPDDDVVSLGFGDGHCSPLDYEAVLAAAPAHEPAPRSGDQVAVIGYTSGTTGRPKGAMLTGHDRAMSAFGYAVAMGIAPGSCFLACLPPYVTRGGSGSFATALVGGHTIVDSFDAERVLGRIEDDRVSLLILVPTMIQRLLDAGLASRDVSSVRQVFTSGAPSGTQLLRDLAAAVPAAMIGSTYGMTEATGIAMIDFEVAGASDAELARRLAAAGRPMSLVDVRVVDQDGQDLAAGEVGEIWVRGETVTRGYWGEPELTVRAISNGWFHTGDFGRLDPDGLLFIVDRRIDIINSGGLNIYSAEIERVLADHPEVDEAAVVGAPDGEWGESVVAYVVRSQGSSLAADDVVGWSTARLASYKKPKLVAFVESLPRNAMGKVLKSALREDAAVRFGAR